MLYPKSLEFCDFINVTSLAVWLFGLVIWNGQFDDCTKEVLLEVDMKGSSDDEDMELSQNSLKLPLNL